MSIFLQVSEQTVAQLTSSNPDNDAISVMNLIVIANIKKGIFFPFYCFAWFFCCGVVPFVFPLPL